MSVEVRFTGVTRRYRDVTALDALDLVIEPGELLVLVGPSGSGKSTALRLLAGLDRPDDGAITIDGVDTAGLAPQHRRVGMVFQDYALYPHLTVRQNLGFGLSVRRVPRAEAARLVDDAAATVGLDGLLDRYPDQLSGGQQQRVALARAMVRDPAVYLMDEPLSNLDAQLRTATRAEIVRLHRRLRTTTVYVTHDQAEAMTVGDRIAVLVDGRLEQVGTPQDVHDRPTTLAVAAFLGSPAMNLVAGGGVLGGLPGQTVGVRPEDLHPDPSGDVEAEVAIVEPLGSETVVHVACADGTPLVVRRPARAVHAVGSRLRLAVDPARLHAFDVATGARVAAGAGTAS